MISCGSFDFAAPPLCGAYDFLRMLETATGRHNHVRHAYPNAAPPSGFLLSLSRHPVSWLADCFDWLEVVDHSKIEFDLAELSKISKLSNGELRTFLNLYLSNCSGLVSRLFDQYDANSVLRFEDFPFAPAEFLESVGIKVTPDRRFQPPPKITPSTISPELRYKIVQAESDFCERYDYY